MKTNKELEADIKEFVKSSRYKQIQRIKHYAQKNGYCKEQIDRRCAYPHCGCLFTDDGVIDPELGILRREDEIL
jgi:hypothetical protein